MASAHLLVEWVLHVVCPQNALSACDLLSLSRCTSEAVSPSPHLIISASSCCRSHVKLKAATDALFKVSSEMVLKCNTAISLMWAKYLWRRLLFLWIGGFVPGSHYRTPMWMSKEKTMKKSPPNSACYLHLYQDIISSYFLHQVSVLPLHWRSQNVTWGQ